MTRLGDFLQRIEAGKSFGGAARPAAADEWGIVKVSAMTWGVFRPGENKVVTEQDRIDQRYEITQGDVLVSRANTSDYVGASVLVRRTRTKLLLSDKSLRLVPRPGVDPAYLHAILSSPQVRRQISDLATGTKDSMRNISQAALMSVEIPTPPPFPEQRRIVDLLEDQLSRLDAADAYLSAGSAKLRALRERLVVSAITGVDRPDKAPAALDNSGTADGDLPPLPVGWTWTRLHHVADVVGGVTKDEKRQSDPSFVEVPYLRVANVQRGRLNLNNVATIHVHPAKAESLQLQPGDVLLNEGGDRDKLARGWVWEGQIPKCIHQNHVFRARLREPNLDPYFLSWTANTFGGRWAERNGKQSVNLASISLNMIKQMPVIVPAAGEAAPRMKALADHLGALDRLSSSLISARAHGLAVRRALLAAAFSGHLTGEGAGRSDPEAMISE